MPNIMIELVSVTKEEKTALVAAVTKTCHEVLNVPEQAFTVFIHENSLDNIGVGGKLLSSKEH